MYQEFIFVTDLLGPHRPEIQRMRDRVSRNQKLLPSMLRSAKVMARREKINLANPDPYRAVDLNTLLRGANFWKEIRTLVDCGMDPSKPMHLLATGKTFMGKTSLKHVMMDWARPNSIPFWSADLKQDDRHLIQIFPDVYPVRIDEGFPFNPACPPVRGHEGIYKRWLFTMFYLLCQGADLLSGSLNFAYSLVDEMMEITRKAGRYANLFDVEILIKSALKGVPPSSPKGLFGRRLLSRLEGYLTLMGGTYDCSAGPPIEDLVKENITWETDGMDPKISQFHILVLLFSNFFYRLYRGPRGEGIKQLIFIDEADSILMPGDEKKYASGIPAVNQMLARSLEFGVIYAIFNQSSRLSHGIKDNAGIKVTFNLGSAYCIQDVSASMNLTPEQKARIQDLESGDVIVSADGHPPYRAKVNLFPLTKNVSEESVMEHNRPFLEKLRGMVVPSVSRQAGGDGEKSLLSHEEERFLFHLEMHRGFTQDQHMQALGLTTNRVRSIRKKLEALGFIRTAVIMTGNKGRQPVALGVTDKGREYLRSRRLKLPKGAHGDEAHNFWVDRMKEHYEKKGWHVVLEVKLNEGCITDMLVHGEGDRRIGGEVEMKAYRAADKAQKLLDCGLDAVVIAVDGAQARKTAERDVKKRLGDDAHKIRIVQVQDFY